MQDLDTMTNVILNNEYKLHEEEQKTNFESGNNGNNNQNNNNKKKNIINVAKINVSSVTTLDKSV